MEAALYLLEKAEAAWDQPGPTYVLYVAAKGGFFEFIKPLLRYVRSNWASDEDVAQLLADAADFAIAAGLPVACLQAFAEEGLDLKRAQMKSTEGDVFLLLHAACKHGRSDVAAFLLQHGCDPLESDE